MGTKETREYYERTQFLYNLLWSKKALSYGFWKPETKSIDDAIENQHQLVRNLLQIKNTDHLLDLGCGTGGCAIRLAQLTGCRVTGITLSEKQIAQANRMAKSTGVEKLVSFQCVNFEQPLPFKNESFTKAYSVEALIYALDKAAVLKEAFRVITPGGLFLVLDGFLRVYPLPQDQMESFQTCITGWSVTNVAEKKQFQTDLKRAGFSLLQWADMTCEVIALSQRIKRRGLFLWPITFLLSEFHIIPKALHQNTLTMIEQRRAFDTFAEYGVVLASR